MPSFLTKLRGKSSSVKHPQGTKKSSSMGSLYKDYSGSAKSASVGGWQQQQLQQSQRTDVAHETRLSASYPKEDGATLAKTMSVDTSTCVGQRFQSYHQHHWRQQENESEFCALREENELLRLKVEILLDMLAQKTAEAELMEADMLKMRNILANA